MPRHYHNGLGIGILVVIMSVTPLIPAAVSAPQPQWVWDANGKVHDASGQYRSLTDEEACRLLDLCKEEKPNKPPLLTDGGDSSGGNGCR